MMPIQAPDIQEKHDGFAHAFSGTSPKKPTLRQNSDREGFSLDSQEHAIEPDREPSSLSSPIAPAGSSGVTEAGAVRGEGQRDAFWYSIPEILLLPHCNHTYDELISNYLKEYPVITHSQPIPWLFRRIPPQLSHIMAGIWIGSVLFKGYSQTYSHNPWQCTICFLSSGCEEYGIHYFSPSCQIT